MTENIYSALAAFQGEMPTIAKSKRVNTGKYGYSYADLASIAEVAYPLLSKHGLSFTCLPQYLETGGLVLTGRLAHMSGDFIECHLPLANVQNPQQLGSDITYKRRYVLGCLTGIVTDEDDDGQLAVQAAEVKSSRLRDRVAVRHDPASAPSPEPAGEPVTQAQLKKLHASFGDLGVKDDATKRATYKYVTKRAVESSADLSKTEAGMVIDYLEKRISETEIVEGEIVDGQEALNVG